MNFTESYLVPKKLYDDITAVKRGALLVPPSGKTDLYIDSNLPDDVKLKLLDYHKRFGTAVKNNGMTRGDPLPEDGQALKEKQMEEIIGSVRDFSKKKLATKIVRFIVDKGGGTIGWDDNFTLIIDGVKHFGTDVRDCIKVTVGEMRDTLNKTDRFVEKLESLGINPNLTMFASEGVKKEKYEPPWHFFGRSWKKEEEEEDGSPDTTTTPNGSKPESEDESSVGTHSPTSSLSLVSPLGKSRGKKMKASLRTPGSQKKRKSRGNKHTSEQTHHSMTLRNRSQRRKGRGGGSWESY